LWRGGVGCFIGALLCPIDSAVTLAALCAQIRGFLLGRSIYNPNLRPSKRLSFLQIGADRYFDHTSCNSSGLPDRPPFYAVLRKHSNARAPFLRLTLTFLHKNIKNYKSNKKHEYNGTVIQ